jgi:rubrerythrin
MCKEKGDAMGFQDKAKLSEQLSDAMGQAKANQQEIQQLRKQLLRQKTIARAMWNLVSSKLNLTEKDLAGLIDDYEAEQRKMALKVADLCSKCGRSLQQDQSACIYCGEPIPRAELSIF